MPFTKEISLEEWIEEANRASEGEKPLTAIRVKHVLFAESGHLEIGDEVCGKVFAANRKWSAKDVASEFLHRCRNYAQGLRGEQSFKAEAYYATEQALSFLHFTVAGKMAGREGETFDATPRGQNAQGQALLQLLATRTFAMQDRMWQMTEALIGRFEGEARHYAGRALEAEGIVLEMVRERALDMGNQKMRQLEFERATGERKQFITFLPALLRKITGSNIVPDDLADSSILETAALKIREMSPEQQVEVMTKLGGVSHELVMVLQPRLAEIAARQERDEEAVRMLAEVRSAEQKEADAELAKTALGFAKGDGTPVLNS